MNLEQFKIENRRLIFMDGEFADLSSNGVKLLSIGLIADNGEKLYLELTYREEDCNEWVRKNVIPYLRAPKISKFAAVDAIDNFVRKHYGYEKPVLVADVNQFDWLAIQYLYDTATQNTAAYVPYPMEVPFYYIPIDLSTLMYAKGLDIDCSRMELAKEFGLDVDKLHQHNALDDAIVVKYIYDKLIKL